MAGHDIITGDGKKFFAQIEELKKLQVRIGYQRGSAVKVKAVEGNNSESEKEEVDYCDIAMWNELGTSNGIPSRPFLRQSVDSNGSNIDAACKEAIQSISQGETAQSVLNKLGVYGKGLVQQTIADGEFEPNKPSTIKRKKSDKPLVDTGGLRKNVNYIICKKGEYD